MSDKASESPEGARSSADLRKQYNALERRALSVDAGSGLHVPRDQALDLWKRLLEQYALLELSLARELAETRHPDPKMAAKWPLLRGLEGLPLREAIGNWVRYRQAKLDALRSSMSRAVFRALGHEERVASDSGVRLHLSPGLAKRMLDVRIGEEESPELRGFPWPGAPEAAVRRGGAADGQREMAMEIEEIIASLAYEAANRGQDSLQLSNGDRLSADMSLEVVLELGVDPNDASSILKRLHSELLAFAKGNVLQGEWGKLEVENGRLCVRLKPRGPRKPKTPRKRKASWV